MPFYSFIYIYIYIYIYISFDFESVYQFIYFSFQGVKSPTNQVFRNSLFTSFSFTECSYWFSQTISIIFLCLNVHLQIITLKFLKTRLTQRFFYINIYTLNKKFYNHQAYIYMLWYIWVQKNIHIKYKKNTT